MSVRRIVPHGLSDILGSFLGSVIEAQSRSSRASVDFIEDVGFKQIDGKDSLRTIKVRYSKLDENNDAANFEVDIPLLAMVNVPYLSVKEATLKFSYDIISTEQEKPDSQTPHLNRISQNFLSLPKLKLNGLVKKNSSADGSYKKSSSIDLEIVLAQQDIPIGVERLFDLAELGMIEKRSEEAS